MSKETVVIVTYHRHEFQSPAILTRALQIFLIAVLEYYGLKHDVFYHPGLGFLFFVFVLSYLSRGRSISKEPYKTYISKI
jgi:hypothetical protein